MTYPVTLLSLGGVKGQGGFAFFRFSDLSSLVVELTAHIFLSQILSLLVT